MKKFIGNDWDELLADEWEKPYYQKLRTFLINEYRQGPVYPPQQDIYNALRLTPYGEVKAVILGQDPYHEPGQAQGLSFSVPYDVPAPPSLVNILKELNDDLGIRYNGGHSATSVSSVNTNTASALSANNSAATGRADDSNAAAGAGVSGILVPWARQGVLLLNTVMTVRAHKAGSHRNCGWELFTDRIIELLASREKPLVFILWGANAGAKSDLIVRAQTGGEPLAPRRHLIIRAPHPSPLSAYRGFFGGRYFSRCNYFLEDSGIEPIDWRL